MARGLVTRSETLIQSPDGGASGGDVVIIPGNSPVTIKNVQKSGGDPVTGKDTYFYKATVNCYKIVAGSSKDNTIEPTDVLISVKDVVVGEI